ncbi:MAG: sugar ABC transporter substrate-binding protein [Promethearchaeota archaeon CR_4]|nr:MAG: sugar ABC transporter substrate-binding protein [Candidatus Lokiarchaeota archaeon CR_4]
MTNWSAFFTACQSIIDAGIGITKPISLGESWTAAHTFEQIMASQGIDFYEDWVNGKVTSATAPKLLYALGNLSTYLSFCNTDSASLTWDAATAKLIASTAVFNVMGDWANGEFLAAEQTFGVEYNVTMVPGTGDMYGLCIDTFQTPNNAPHPTNSRRWLEVVGSQAGQDAFNPLKGSISARTDANLSKYGMYQRNASTDFKSVTYMFPSVVHGSGAPEAFKVGLQTIISQFVSDKNIANAAAAIIALTAECTWTKVWNLV